MMKKYIVLTVLTLTLTGGLLTGCGSGTDIGQDAAKEAAFADAQVAEEDTSRLRVTKDRDDGRQIYEVEFTAGNREYNYDIDASDGSILSTETEELQGSTGNSQETVQGSTSDNTANDTAGESQSGSQDASQRNGSQDDQSGQSTQNTQTQNNQSQTGQNSSADVAVSEADARAAALERVPGATDTDIKMELDFDDGQYIYEGDIIYDGKEYEFEIDANTGNFLKWSEEKW